MPVQASNITGNRLLPGQTVRPVRVHARVHVHVHVLRAARDCQCVLAAPFQIRGLGSGAYVADGDPKSAAAATYAPRRVRGAVEPSEDTDAVRCGAGPREARPIYAQAYFAAKRHASEYEWDDDSSGATLDDGARRRVVFKERHLFQPTSLGVYAMPTAPRAPAPLANVPRPQRVDRVVSNSPRQFPSSGSERPKPLCDEGVSLLYSNLTRLEKLRDGVFEDRTLVGSRSEPVVYAFGAGPQRVPQSHL